MSEWRDLSTSPRDGTPILVTRDNGCFWEHNVVWWSRYHPEYPWQSDHSAYPEDRFDYWMPLPPSPDERVDDEATP